jgi:hypothetical protein
MLTLASVKVFTTDTPTAAISNPMMAITTTTSMRVMPFLFLFTLAPSLTAEGASCCNLDAVP